MNSITLQSILFILPIFGPKSEINMFYTTENAMMEIPSVLLPADQHVWSYVFSELNMYWLHVVTGIKNQEGDYDYRAYFLSEIEDLVTLSNRQGTKILEASLISPGYMNGTEHWQMDLLEAISGDRGPNTEYPEYFHVFTLTNGDQYTYPSECDISSLKDIKTIYNSRYNNNIKNGN